MNVAQTHRVLQPSSRSVDSPLLASTESTPGAVHPALIPPQELQCSNPLIAVSTPYSAYMYCNEP